jgi:ABC-2 type transport system permease protein
MTALADTSFLTLRRIRAFLRQPYYLAVTLVQPLVWLLLFGQLFRRITELPGFGSGSYIAYLTPGIVVMTALFSNGWSGMSLIVDMERGVLDRLLVSPARRVSLLAGELAYQSTTTLVQTLIIGVLGLALGARFSGGGAVALAFVAAVVLLGCAFASFSNAVALAIRKEESLIALVNFLVLPLSFLSSTFMAPTLQPHWIRVVERFNPVNWTVEIGRQTLHAGVDWSLVGSRLGMLLLLALCIGAISMRAFAAYRRSV